MDKKIQIIDLNFLEMKNTIASYLFAHKDGVALIECGPSSTLPQLEKGLHELGFNLTDITSIFVTHIHLDHAGAAGYLASKGAQIYVHEFGAPHLINPTKLIRSASRIYGDQMEFLWGKITPVPKNKVTILKDNDSVNIGNIIVTAIDTPGHANHHLAYIVNDVCFTGDVGGIRLQGKPHIRLPMPPPEFNWEKWMDTANRLSKLFSEKAYHAIAPTHFGIYNDVHWHLSALKTSLQEINQWMEVIMPKNLPIEIINEEFLNWTRERSLSAGLSEKTIELYEAANPSFMSSYGIQRYWKKYRQTPPIENLSSH